MDEAGRAKLRKPGNRVVRRRVEAQQIMELPPPPPARQVPSIQSNAKRFALAYGVLVLVGTALLSTPLASERGTWTPVIDALFTSVSATSVTGLITVDTQDHWTFFGELLILVMIQLGGLGFMVGASLVLVAMRRSNSLHGNVIMRDGGPTISLSEARDLSRRVLRFTLLVESVGAVLLTITFYPDADHLGTAIWFGVFHSISAFCNAGFDLQGGERSLLGYQSSLSVNVVIMSLIQLGALSYMLFGDLWAKRLHWRRGERGLRRYWTRLSLDTRLILLTNYALVFAGAATFLAIEWDASLAGISGTGDRVVASLFQSVSARTAGFATIAFGEAHPATIFLWIALMAIGGASGSTAGGIKLATVGVLVIAVISTLRGQTEAQYAGRRIPTALVFRAITITALFVATHFVITLLLALTEDVIDDNAFSFQELMFEAMSALATVGVTTGITGDISTAGKLVLCIAMFIGRLGPLTVVYALQRRAASKAYSYPEAFVRLG